MQGGIRKGGWGTCAGHWTSGSPTSADSNVPGWDAFDPLTTIRLWDKYHLTAIIARHYVRSALFLFILLTHVHVIVV